MRKFLRDNGVSLLFLGLFLAALIGQPFVGLAPGDGASGCTRTRCFW